MLMFAERFTLVSRGCYQTLSPSGLKKTLHTDFKIWLSVLLSFLPFRPYGRSSKFLDTFKGGSTPPFKVIVICFFLLNSCLLSRSILLPSRF